MVLVHARLRVGGWKKRRFRCQVRTLSEVLHTGTCRASICSKSTSKVVNGRCWLRRAEQWKRIRQVVVEVHDVSGRVGDVDQLLKHHGYQTAVDQEDWAVLALLGIATVYAWRAAA
jgi:hypothetical protein